MLNSEKYFRKQDFDGESILEKLVPKIDKIQPKYWCF